MNRVALSKKLSYILRHNPESVGVTLDPEGWCDLSELINKAGFTLPELQEIVCSDEKGRYTLDEGANRIRANQGHSTDGVNISFRKVVPPIRLFHGTIEEVANEIMRKGLLKMNRHHVHLADDFYTAHTVGSRRGKRVVVLEVNCAEMFKDGHDFYQSDNGVWLVDHVPPKYLTEL